MATVRGKSDVKRFIAGAPAQIQDRLLRGAARAAANVVATEARERVESDEVRGAIKVATKRDGNRIVAKVQVKVPGAYLAPWLEYGTDPHFILVDQDAMKGMSAGRVNRLDAKAAANGGAGPGASLVINGRFVGATIHHPGARPHPFLRVSLDVKEAEAIAAAQRYINARVTPAGITGSEEEDADA